MTFSLSLTALLGMFLLSIALYYLKKPAPPAFPYPIIKEIVPDKRSLKTRLIFLPRFLNYLALGALMTAFVDPHLTQKILKPYEKNATEGIAIYLVLDQSGSMQEQIVWNNAQGSREYITKLDLLKQMTTQFIKARPQDLIGIVSFARTAYTLTPLTLDHQEVLAKLNSLSKIPDESQEGTAIGYAIFKTVNLIVSTRHFANEKEAYTIRDAIIILITDGFQNPNPLDLDNKLRSMGIVEAAEYAKSRNVKFYLINVEPAMQSEKYLPERHQMERATALTGGKFYMASDPDALSKVYADINRLQKSALPAEKLIYEIHRISFYPYFIACGIALLALSVLLDTTWLRRAP